MERILAHLGALVAADTRNPPRAITPEHPCVVYVADALRAVGCLVDVDDLGGGSVNVLAMRGEADTLINCHLDTVPSGEGWTRDPFALAVENGRAYGLGACDVKGAASALLAAVEGSDAPAAVLFTTDEEAGRAACVRGFLAGPPRQFRRVVVCEPTGCRLGLSHPGIVSIRAEFAGEAGHSSAADSRSAVHDAVRWGAAMLGRFTEGGSLRHRLNIGRVEGGVKANICAESASVLLGARPGSEREAADILEACASVLPGVSPAVEVRFRAPALPASGADVFKDLGIETIGSLPFWTEAALFAEAGIPAAVFGPGDIAQAHAADEFVGLDQLELASRRYAQILGA